MCMLKIESKRDNASKSHEDADMQDVGGTTSEKHRENIDDAMPTDAGKTNLTLDLKSPLEATITANGQKKTADQSLHEGKGMKRYCIAHHRRHR